MGKTEIEQFLTWLAVEQKVSPATQNQAFSAILFLYGIFKQQIYPLLSHRITMFLMRQDN
jgi:hypothetical protein